jgi:lactate dehydrogenase-like 2-hydroxyacid dehydrogenase
MQINRENFERYSAIPAPDYTLIHFGNGEPNIDAVAAENPEALIVDAIAKIGAEFILRLPNLKLIHSQGVGYNGIDLETAARAGVYVCNCAGMNAAPVAEQAVLLILALLKRFRGNEDAVYAGKQMAAKTACFENSLPELGGCIVGIVGLGAIGLETAKRLQAFGCKVYYYSRTKKPEAGFAYMQLNELLQTCDIVSLHVPVTEATERLIDRTALNRFKPGALLINTARGELVDIEAVVEALRSGQLGGFGTDTLAPEPVLADNTFLTMLPAELRERVALSPHIAGITADSFRRAYKRIWENVGHIARGERPSCVVNGL